MVFGETYRDGLINSVTNVLIIGWVTMFSGSQGAEIGIGMVEDLSKNS
jgi:hypothetical protein